MANKFDHDIWITSTLAENSSYSCHVAYWPEEDQKVLLKHVNPSSSTQEREKVEERLLKEAAILEEFWSSYFPKIYDIRKKQDTGELYILSEYFSGERLDRFIEKYPEKALTAKFYLHLFFELKFALSYLHNKKKIIHFDLTPDNIIIDLENGVHVIDFENSRVLGSPLSTLEVRGKEGFLPPEILNEPKKKDIFATEAIDIYALGKVLSSLYEKLPITEKIALIGKEPDLQKLLHQNPGMRSLQSSKKTLNTKPIVTVAILLITILFIPQMEFTTNQKQVVQVKKENYRRPALPSSIKKIKKAPRRSSLRKSVVSDQISNRQSAPKRKQVLTFQKRFLTLVGKQDSQLKECLNAFNPQKVDFLKLRYHIEAPKQKLVKLEVIEPKRLSSDGRICLTSLYKDLKYPQHKSKKSYTIDQSFTFSHLSQ